MNNLTNKQKLVFLALLSLPLLMIAFLAFSSAQFKVTATDPGQNKKINTYGVAVLTYSQPITADKAKISTSPDMAFSTTVDKNKLVIRPLNALKNVTRYTVKVENVCEAKQPKKCTTYTLTFSTDENIPLNSLSKEQQKQLIAPVDSQYRDVPILAILPVHDTDYLIDPQLFGSGFTYIVITPNMSSNGLTPDEYDATYAQYYQEGVAYLKSKGYALQGPKFKVVSSQEYNKVTHNGE